MSAAAEPEAVRIAAVSDLYGRLPEIADVPRCDVLLIAGDIIPLLIQNDIEKSLEWLAGEFAHWLDCAPAGEVTGIAGNHDFWAAPVGEGAHPRLFGARWSYLCDAGLTTSTGLTVWGSPWIPFLAGGWCFTAPKSHGGDFVASKFAAIPDRVDVLLTHSPPLSLRDVTQGGERMGSPALRAAVLDRHPRLVICGHVHESAGATGIGTYGDWTLIANVSVLGCDYQPNNRPIELFDVPLDRKLPVERVRPR